MVVTMLYLYKFSHHHPPNGMKMLAYYIELGISDIHFWESDMSDEIQKAIDLYNIGEKKQAYEILVALIDKEPKNVDAWFALALCIDDKNHKKYCLNKVLELDPSNKKAHNLIRNIDGHNKRFLLIGGFLLTFVLIFSVGIILIYFTFFQNRLIPLTKGLENKETSITEITPTNSTETIGIIPENIDIRKLTLEPKDVNQDYELNIDESGYWSNEDIANGRPNPIEYNKQLIKWGRINGYRALYTNHKDNKVIEYVIILMKNNEDTKLYFDYIHHQDISDGWSDINSDNIGDESILNYKNFGGNNICYQNMYRKFNVIITVNFCGSKNLVSTQDALDLSKKSLIKFSNFNSSSISDLLPNKSGGFSFPLDIISGSTFPSLPAFPPTQTLEPTTIPYTINQTQSLGPIWDSLRDETYSIEITVHDVIYKKDDYIRTPKAGHIYMIVNITIKNIGNSPLRSISQFDFQIKDPNGALHDTNFVPGTNDCELNPVDLLPNGKVSGCLGFEVPTEGTLELIYAPYRYESLEPGRYLSFILRP
jgi:hypothetical protein